LRFLAISLQLLITELDVVRLNIDGRRRAGGCPTGSPKLPIVELLATLGAFARPCREEIEQPKNKLGREDNLATP